MNRWTLDLEIRGTDKPARLAYLVEVVPSLGARDWGAARPRELRPDPAIVRYKLALIDPRPVPARDASTRSDAEAGIIRGGEGGIRGSGALLRR